jgi:hypothetical protein
MRTIFSLVAAAAVLAGAAPAAAQRWYRVGGDAAAVAYVDADSIRGRGDVRTGNVYTVFNEPFEGRLHASSIRSEFHCTENYFRTLEYSYFGAGNALIATEPSSRPNERKQPQPNSFNLSFFNFVCRGTGGVEVGADAWRDARVFLEERAATNR